MEVFEKSHPVDPEVRAYVSSLVNAVGGQSTLDDRYEIGDDALAVLNDIIRWVRLYDDKTDRYDVKRCLADAHFLPNDLLSILALWPEEAQDNKWKAKLALVCLQLIVTLTWPMEVSEEKTKVNHVRHMPVLQLAQVGYKRAIMHYEDAQILRTVVRIGLPAMAIERRERSRRDEGIVKLMLYCFRNVVMINQPQHLPSQGDENEVSRSATIDAFHQQEVFNLLLTVGSGANDEFQDSDVIVLETLFHLLKGVDPQKLFMEEKQLAKAEVNELQSLMQKEKAMLNSQNKHAPTRHNRFGTMLWIKRDDNKVSTVIGQGSITNSSGTLQQMDASKKFDKPRFRGKQTLELNESEDYGGKVELTESARKHLRGFVEDFLDSCFNPLFSHLRKDIGGDAERIAPSNHRQFWYLISWFLQAEAARREQRRLSSNASTSNEDNTYAYIAAVLDQETFVLLSRHMQRNYDEKSWQELRATLKCFTQILLTVQNMAESTDEEDQEIAENIQNRIFYEETTHDRIVQICRTYSNQGLGYLDAVTECVHVFVRMLETYSKQNVDLQIRSKRRARRKQKKNEAQQDDNSNEQDNDDGNAAEDEREAHLTVSERKFDFARFSAKFLSQACVNTFVALTGFYADLDPAQLKRCHRFFYRLAFKAELAVLLFRVDILQLFQRMIKGPNALDASSVESFKEWQQLIQQIFRRCFKWIDRETEGEGWREAAIVEMLFSKIPGTMFYLQNGYERVVEKRAPRPPAELEVKPSVAEIDKRVGIAVSVLLEQAKGDDIEWIKKELKRAGEERQAWEDEQTARAGPEGGEAEAESTEKPSAPAYFVTPDTDERKEALFKDKYLRLLMTTLGLQRLGTSDDTEASWIIPGEVPASQLQDLLGHIQSAEFNPPTFDEDQTAQSLIRAKSTHTARFQSTFGESDSDNDSTPDEALFPANLRHAAPDGAERPKKKRRLTRRNRAELTEEQLKEREDNKRKKERERNGKIKSKLFVTESDEESDEERDREFFRLEAERRGKVRKEIKKAVAGIGKKVGAKDDGADLASDEDMGIDVDSGSESETGGAQDRAGFNSGPLRQRLRGNESSASDDEDQVMEFDYDQETPSTSPPSIQKSTVDGPLTEVSANTSANKRPAMFLEDSGDEDEQPVVKPATQRRRIVVDDEDDE
jgi:replication fork protection complex subunit Tof1/Swi1